MELLFHSFFDRQEQSKCVLRVFCNRPRLPFGCRFRKGGGQEGFDESLCGFKPPLSYTAFFLINLQITFINININSSLFIANHFFVYVTYFRIFPRKPSCPWCVIRVCKCHAIPGLVETDYYSTFFFYTRPHLSDKPLQTFIYPFPVSPYLCSSYILDYLTSLFLLSTS